jgi:hypothetical protein
MTVEGSTRARAATGHTGERACGLIDGLFAPQAHRVLVLYATALRVRFTLGAMPFGPDDIFAPEGFLPLIAMRADERMREHGVTLSGSERQGLSRGLGMRLSANPDALLGQTVEISTLDRVLDPLSTIRVLYLTEAADTVLGLDEDVTIDCLPLIERFAPPQVEHADRNVKWPLTRTQTSR